jgi:diguanylate cyclase (GGDEF)-like protein
VPTFASSSFIIDLPTLCLVTVFISLVGGLLLLFAWLQNRSERALALWGCGYLLGCSGAAVLGMGIRFGHSFDICVGNALMCSAYGTMWAGARSFEGRRVPVPLVLTGAVIWILVWNLPVFSHTTALREYLVSFILTGYVLLGAREMWYPRDRELISRWPTMALVVIHGGFLLARIPYLDTMAYTPLAPHQNSIGGLIMSLEALFVAFCLPFLRVSMAKERAELSQRKAALTDSLTGIANRRAFFDAGEPLLERTLADRRPGALLLFDLDRFKEVNDTAGHQAGDRVLQGFSHLVAAALRPGDLFARLGGEEFACLLPDTPMAAALQLAERVRGQFAAAPNGLATATTVSCGVAMASETGRSLSGLLANADRALYRAKADGRNRVAPAPLILVDSAGVELAPGAKGLAPVPVMATPLVR